MENLRVLKRTHHRDFVPKTRSVYTIKKKSQVSTPIKSLEGWILFVSNLHEETTEDDLREAFSEYGNVININLNLDRRTGFVKGYALIEYDTYKAASTARESLNNSDLLGVSIKVDWCFVDNKTY